MKRRITGEKRVVTGTKRAKSSKQAPVAAMKPRNMKTKYCQWSGDDGTDDLCNKPFKPKSGNQRFCATHSARNKYLLTHPSDPNYRYKALQDEDNRNGRTAFSDRVRSDMINCGQPRADGSPCCMPAGWGTEHVGYGSCRKHAGNTESHQVAAGRERVAELMMHDPILGTPKAIDPHTAISDELARTAAHVEWYRMRIIELGVDPAEVADPNYNQELLGERVLSQFTERGIMPSVWLESYRAERSHLVRVCKEAVSMGVQEREVRMMEQQARIMVVVFQNVTMSKDLALDSRQLSIIPDLLRTELLKVSSNPEAIESTATEVL